MHWITTLDDLHEAFQRRVEQLVYTAIHDAQPWLIDELANLDNNGHTGCIQNFDRARNASRSIGGFFF